MKNHMEVVPIDNYPKYESSHKFFLAALVAAGAAVFKGLEESNIIAQGWSITTNAAYYAVAKEEGST